jgi:hypothetical protein
VIFRSSATAAEVHCYIDKLFAAVSMCVIFQNSSRSAAVLLLRQNFQKKFIAAEFSTNVYSANIFLNLMLCNKV